jgi:ABC-type transporter Mla subunit MlaD
MHSGHDSNADELRAGIMLRAAQHVRRVNDEEPVPYLDDVDITPRQAATFIFATSLAQSTNNSNGTTAAFTPAANELLLVYVIASGASADGTVTDNQSGTYTNVASALARASADRLSVHVRNSLTTNVSHQVTWTRSGNNTGVCVAVHRVSGMTRTGSSAVRQFKVASNQAAAGTPATTFDTAAITTNATVAFVGNGTNPGGVTPPTSWTGSHNDGYNTPSTGIRTAYRNSGFTGTTITWGGTSASAFGVIAIELDNTPPPVTGTVAQTLADFTSAIDGLETFEGSVAQTLADFTPAIDGDVQTSSPVSGTVAVALGSVTPAISGLEDFAGAVAATLGAFTPTISGAESFDGTVAVTLDAFTPAIAGLETIQGAIAQTLGDFTPSASGTVVNPIAGTVAATLGAFTPTISGAESFDGTVAVTLDAFTPTIAGLETIQGTAAVTLDAFTPSISGLESYVGSVAQTLGDFTSTTSGVVLNPVAGTVAATLDAFTPSISGLEAFAGSVAATLDSFTTSIAGLEEIGGAVAVTLGSFTPSISGLEALTGTVAATLGSFIPSIAGLETIQGAVAQTLGGFTPSIAGLSQAPPVDGTISVTLGAFAPTVAGLVANPASGTISVTLSNVVPNISGAQSGVTVSGSMSVVLGSVTPHIRGMQPYVLPPTAKTRIVVGSVDDPNETDPHGTNTMSEKPPLSIWLVTLDLSDAVVTIDNTTRPPKTRSKQVASVAWQVTEYPTGTNADWILLGSPRNLPGGLFTHLIEGGDDGVLYKMKVTVTFADATIAYGVAFLPVVAR